MNCQTGRLGWLWRWLGRVGRGRIIAEEPIRMIVTRADDGEDEGPGVPVPAGPRPLCGGARAKPPPERAPH